MNPTLPQFVIDQAMGEDEASARAEYFAEFRRDVESFVSLEAVQACVVPSRLELPRLRCPVCRLCRSFRWFIRQHDPLHWTRADTRS